MGRPPKSADERLSERVGFRVTPVTKKQYASRLAESGLSESEWFRECVMSDRTEIIVPVQITANMRKSLSLLSNIANNINQIAHALNIAVNSDLISPPLVEKVLARLEEILISARNVQEQQ